MLEVVEAEGCLEAAACGLLEAKDPPEVRDSPARESEVTRPVGSLRVAGVEVYWEVVSLGLKEGGGEGSTLVPEEVGMVGFGWIWLWVEMFWGIG